MQTDPHRTGLGTWTAFLAAPFAVLALIGLFATYAVGLPHERWVAREIALERAAALPPGLPAGDVAALRRELGDAAKVLDAADRPAAVVAARADSRAFFLRQSEAVRGRMRLLLGVGGLACFAFGAMVLGWSRR